MAQQLTVSGTESEGRTIEVGGSPLKLRTQGQGRPLLVLHGEIGIAVHDRFIELLARNHEVFLPIHPGFETSGFVEQIETVEDLSYLYLDLIETLDLTNVVVVGLSLGGWVAAEMAVKSTARISHLVLVDAFGIKISGREIRDIVDLFGVGEKELAELAYFDEAFARNKFTELPDEEVITIAQNREATARYGWSPYMHNPKLKDRLHRITVPTLVLWGAQDRIVSTEYGRAYCKAIPQGRFELIDDAGHYPQIEQPDEIADKIRKFVVDEQSSRQSEPTAIIGADR
jgi:pimeloyl-ACP methyl ester carboxylesterase